MATSKLNYANIRAAQRKNKSLHEAKDLLPKNLHPNPSHYNNVSPPFPLDQLNKPSKEPNAKGKMTYSLFEEQYSAEIPSYAKTLFGRFKEESSSHQEKVGRGHHRVKSSITEMYQKGPEILDEHERGSKGATLGRFETNSNRGVQVNYEAFHENESIGGMVARLEEDARKARERSIKENNSKAKEERGYGGTGHNKEGRMLSDFLRKDGGFGKETASPEGARQRKKELSIEQEHVGNSIDKKSGIKMVVDNSPKNISIEDNMSSNEDFLTRLDNYIDYFKKSQRSHRKNSKGVIEYPGEERGKSHEDGGKDHEIKMLRKQVEGLNMKLHEVMKANKKILKEFSHMLLREDEYVKRLGMLEEDFAHLKRRNKRYQEKLKATTQMLEKERMENESNLNVLSKLLSSGVNMMLDTKMRKHVDEHRQSKNDFREGPRNSAQKRKEDKHERHSSSEKRAPGRKDEMSYSQKMSLFSDDSVNMLKRSQKRSLQEDDYDSELEEERLDTIQQEEDDAVSASSDNRYKKETTKSPSRNKNTPETKKEHKIRMLQERLVELMEDEYPPKQEQDERVSNQVWPRDIDTGLLNNMKQVKPRNLSKDFMNINTDKYGYAPNIRERHGSYPKVNTFLA